MGFCSEPSKCPGGVPGSRPGPLGLAFKALENCIPEAGLVYCSVSQGASLGLENRSAQQLCLISGGAGAGGLPKLGLGARNQPMSPVPESSAFSSLPVLVPTLE